MKSLRQILGGIKRRLHGQSLPVLDLVEISVVIPNAQTVHLHFDKATHVEIIRHSVALLSGAERDYVELLQEGDLLDDNRLVSDLSVDEQGRIELAAIISRFTTVEGFFWHDEQLDAFPGQPCSDTVTAQSSWFYGQNEQDSVKRVDQLKHLLSNMVDATAPVVIMAFSSNFSSIFINWVRSCDCHHIGVRERAIIFPMDKKSRELAENEGFKVCYDNTSGVLSDIGQSQQYGDVEFRKHMFFQNAIIQDMLKLGCDFLFQDVDLVWLEDPFEYFSGSNDHDIEFMFDGNSAARHGPLCANTGFIYFRAHTETINFWDIIYRNYDRVIQFSSQQQPLNKYLGLLHTRGLKVKILAEDLFANGHLFGPDAKKSRLPERPKVIHCSWTLNLENKIIKYKNNDLWYIKEDS